MFKKKNHVLFDPLYSLYYTGKSNELLGWTEDVAKAMHFTHQDAMSMQAWFIFNTNTRVVILED